MMVLGACQNQTVQDKPWTWSGTEQREGEDPYLTQKYWELNQSPMQTRLRELSPFPVGVVYYQQRGDSLEDAIREFDVIQSLGFTALKQVQLKAPYNPTGYDEAVFHAAIEAGISPWYYGIGGWQSITRQLLDSLEIDLALTPENRPRIQNHPALMAHQRALWHQRVERMASKPAPPQSNKMGEPGRNNPWMPARLIPTFAQWLQNTYGSLDSLKDAWNCGYTGSCAFQSFEQAARELQGTGFDEYGNGVGKLSHDFRRFRDAMKFQSELIVEEYERVMDFYTQYDLQEPERTGGHQLFENQAINAWDLEGQAKAAAVGGSFYASIHLPHHFFLVDNEITRPAYWQARIVADMFKGGWAATWESTGGPTQWSGYQGFTVDGLTMSRLVVSYLAAGLKGIGFWMWNSRGEGWEVGEYALTDLQGQPSERALVAGQFSRALQEQRFELWQALDEPTVGILYSWENEAMLGRLSLGGYDLNTPVYKTNYDRQFRQYHTEARLGVARALGNHHIPYEFLTERDLEAGLAARYPVIYLPYLLALDARHLRLLQDYVAQGGRLVADFPLLMLDSYGRLNKWEKNSQVAQLFGVQIADYQHSFNEYKILNGDTLRTQYGDIQPSGAEIVECFDDGSPSVLSHRFGQGETALLNLEASRLVSAPGRVQLERFLCFYALGARRPPFEVRGARQSQVYRRAAPLADHYFIVNDGGEEQVQISSVHTYAQAFEVLGQTEVRLTNRGMELTVPAGKGLWIRAGKTDAVRP
ncbi:MAG: hypothetical protein HC842_00210 [Cytophagales bacterium]|nr:hypothetical protein [Cytophagales bacterium]